MDKVEVREAPIARETLVGTTPLQMQPSAWRRLKALGARVLNKVFPQFPIPGYCLSCWTRLGMVRDLPLERSDAYLVQGVRFWTCPDCGQGASTRYAYLGDPSLW
ncbi:MAG: hypothetical protein HY683_09980 [Chloroflexi bacterium]|nr:hypothetical protein [Chloroflexota bacterium]